LAGAWLGAALCAFATPLSSKIAVTNSSRERRAGCSLSGTLLRVAAPFAEFISFFGMLATFANRGKRNASANADENTEYDTLAHEDVWRGATSQIEKP
jgi:hypothetical protein